MASDDPFERAAMRTRQALRPEGGRKQGIASMVASEYPAHVLGGLASLPQRAFESAGSLQRGGSYDPGPILEAATLTMGATPFSAPRGALGVGPKGYESYTPDIDKFLKAIKGKDWVTANQEMDAALASGSHAVAKQMKQIVDHELKESVVSDIVGKPSAPQPLKPEYDWLSQVKSYVEHGTAPNQIEALKKQAAGWEDYLKNPNIGPLAGEAGLKKLQGINQQIEALEKKAPPGINFEPLDWRAAISEHPTEFTRNIPQHAVEQGFNPNFPLYKGRASEKRAVEASLPNPAESPYERALFFAEDPNVAKAYGSVTEYVARAKNPAQVDWRSVAGYPDYESGPMRRLIDEAREKGIDLLKIRDMYDIGSGGNYQNQMLVLDPKIVRRPHAAFDPKRIEESNLLSGLAAMGILSGLGALETNRR